MGPILFSLMDYDTPILSKHTFAHVRAPINIVCNQFCPSTCSHDTFYTTAMTTYQWFSNQPSNDLTSKPIESVSDNVCPTTQPSNNNHTVKRLKIECLSIYTPPPPKHYLHAFTAFEGNIWYKLRNQRPFL